MKRRCQNPANPNYADYGGRGIRVCERWQQFEGFLADMGERPKGMTIERNNNDGNYEPGNCRWASWAVQIRNKRNSLRVEYKGTVINLIELAEQLALNYDSLRHHITRGKTLEEALTVALKQGEKAVRKLTEDQVRHIKAQNGKTQKLLAVEFGVTQSVISRIQTGKRRKHVHAGRGHLLR